MFIPKGKAVYENLATSYVLVDALVADLSEGGFSGIVEIVLRDTDSHIIFERGEVAAAIEQREVSKGLQTARNYYNITVAELAARSRCERGRISIYSYSPNTAGAIAARLHAEMLYTRLSADFVDLGKMISKLSRERDRQWFFELNIGSG